MTRHELSQAYLKGKMDRRDFITRLTAMGFSTAAALAYADSLSAAAAVKVTAKHVSGIRALQDDDDDDIYGVPDLDNGTDGTRGDGSGNEGEGDGGGDEGRSVEGQGQEPGGGAGGEGTGGGEGRGGGSGRGGERPTSLPSTGTGSGHDDRGSRLLGLAGAAAALAAGFHRLRRPRPETEE